MNKIILNVENVVLRRPELRFQYPINWTLKEREAWALVGPNGGGKSLFADILVNKVMIASGSLNAFFDEQMPFYQQIKIAAFNDIYSLADYKSMYYQQRWNSTEEDAPIVGDILRKENPEEEVLSLVQQFGVQDLLTKSLILLSSGELRKFLIVRMLLAKPKVLILDNPYIGLDANSRELLNELLAKIVADQQLHLILLLSNPTDIPPFVTDVLPIANRNVFSPQRATDFLANQQLLSNLFPEFNEIPNLPIAEITEINYEDALEMRNVYIRYGNREILKDLNWKIIRGERWALLGPNGAGKSTLLSLVCADNPQAYANDFSLFGRKRGTGESIWDIKKRIGYVSPEIHLYLQYNQSALQIVGSGFFDSIGLYRKCSDSQLQKALEWMRVFQIDDLANRPFLQLSFGQQRLVILARAFVKNPDLLILDEPLHGLDKRNRQLALSIINRFCENGNKTLIYVTHYLFEIPPCVTKQMILKKITAEK